MSATRETPKLAELGENARLHHAAVLREIEHLKSALSYLARSESDIAAETGDSADYQIVGGYHAMRTVLDGFKLAPPAEWGRTIEASA